MSIRNAILCALAFVVTFVLIWKLIVAFVWLMFIAAGVILAIMLGIGLAGAWKAFRG